MADYFTHWLGFETRVESDKLPRIFYVNWFRKNADGKFMWPGFGENSRVLEWIFERCANRGAAVETPIGMLPAPGALDISGLDLDDADIAELLHVDEDEWRRELPDIERHFAQFGDDLPQQLHDQLQALRQRLGV
jgi:phosphoenolpyruvate carboxykinase (GTP)